MVDDITAAGHVEHEVMVQEVEERFGSEWVDVNDNGNPVISAAVLRAFRKAHGGSIDWHGGIWELRGPALPA